MMRKITKSEKELRAAFKANKVTKSEQVQTKDIDVALGMLSTVYGNFSRMIRAKKLKLVTLGKLPKPGSKIVAHLVIQIDWYLQLEVLIECLQKLALDSKDNYCEIYKPSLLGDIKDLFPYDMIKEMIGQFQGDGENKMKMFLTYVRGKRIKVQGMLKESPGEVHVGSGSGGGPGKL